LKRLPNVASLANKQKLTTMIILYLKARKEKTMAGIKTKKEPEKVMEITEAKEALTHENAIVVIK